MKRHSLDDESTHPGSLIAGSRLPPKRGLTWPGSTLVPSYSVESDYAPGPWSAAAAAADEAAAELDPVRAAPEAISRSQPDFGGKRPLSPFKQRVAQARAQELEPIDDDAAAPTCWFCGLGGGTDDQAGDTRRRHQGDADGADARYAQQHQADGQKHDQEDADPPQYLRPRPLAPGT